MADQNKEVIEYIDQLLSFNDPHKAFEVFWKNASSLEKNNARNVIFHALREERRYHQEIIDGVRTQHKIFKK